jgi:hypothetical protein
MHGERFCITQQNWRDGHRERRFDIGLIDDFCAKPTPVRRDFFPRICVADFYPGWFGIGICGDFRAFNDVSQVMRPVAGRVIQSFQFQSLSVLIDLLFVCDRRHDDVEMNWFENEILRRLFGSPDT